MRVLVNGVRLFFDVEGASLVPSGPSIREKPTLLLLHGGPGFDHSIYKPAYSALADCSQVIYLDHRGNGRSDRGPKEAWTLAQWGDDVRTFCDVLGIELTKKRSTPGCASHFRFTRALPAMPRLRVAQWQIRKFSSGS